MQQPNGFSEQKDNRGVGQGGSENWQHGPTSAAQEAEARQGQPATNFSATDFASSTFDQNTPWTSGNFAGVNYGQWFAMGNAKYWFSLLGGVYLAIFGLKRSLGSLTIASAGLGLIYYAWTGEWPLAKQLGNAKANQGGRDVTRAGSTSTGLSSVSPLNTLRAASDSTATKNMIVKAPLNEVYQAWANFENFPNFMDHIKAVTKTGDHTSHWVMEGPLNTKIEWDAETTRQEENKRIAWNSINGDIKTSGQVTFNALPDNQVEVTVMLKYVPPAGLAGEIVAELFSNPEGKLQEDLRNFKRYIEARAPQPA